MGGIPSQLQGPQYFLCSVASLTGNLTEVFAPQLLREKEGNSSPRSLESLVTVGKTTFFSLSLPSS